MKRLLTALLFACIIPVLALSIVWLIVWIFTGRFILTEYIEFLDDRLK